MTHTTTDAAEARALTVIQADRDAAGSLVPLCFGTSSIWQSNVRAGYYDDGEIVQAFARHRLATAEAASVAGEREELRKLLEDGWYKPGHSHPVLSMDADAWIKKVQAIGLRVLASLPPATDPAIPDGWKLVPVEPTGEMAAAGVAAINDTDLDGPSVWSAMLAAAPTIPATGEAEPKPLRVDWNKHDLAEAYDLVEGVRSKMAQSPESPLDTSLRAALDAIEAADCEWDGLTKATIPATGHAATEGEGA